MEEGIFEELDGDLSVDREFLVDNGKHERVIVHIDIDCFYAQVETLRNPSLRGKPLGIQQKNIVVTCNYEARAQGVKKLMATKAAKEICPSLILVNGEDLKHYRDMSARIFEVLQSFTPLVEKLGLDENFLDVTSQTTREQMDSSLAELQGHSYDNTIEEACSCGCKQRLIKGSNIAQEIRTQLKNELGITCCAGIAHNKLLSKLVAGVNKPNQQTTLFPSDSLKLIGSLTSIRLLPGVGSSTYRKLEEIDIKSVGDLQNADISKLNKLLGAKIARHIQQLSWGLDDSPVRMTAKPKSVGAEDGFPSVTTEQEVKQKLRVLLKRVWDLVLKDGRKPGNVKLTVRKVFFNPTKFNTRESRQSTIDFSLNCCKKTIEALTNDDEEKILSLLIKLFRKIVNNDAWQVTLLGISFSGYQDEGKTVSNAIDKYFSNISVSSSLSSRDSVNPTRQNSSRNIEPAPCSSSLAKQEQEDPPRKRQRYDESVIAELPPDIRQEILKEMMLDDTPSCSSIPKSDLKCPPGVDPAVFAQLPKEIQEELMETKASSNKREPEAPKKNNLLHYFRKV